MMSTLSIESPENKTVYIVLAKKENNALLNEQRYNLCEEVNEHRFDFVTVDLEGESSFNPKSLVKIIGKCPIESHGIDIPAYAAGYLHEEIDDLKTQVAGLQAEYEALDDKENMMAQNMASWISVLNDEVASKESTLANEVKPKWLVKRILDIAASFTEDEVYVLHFGVESLLPAMKTLFETVENVKAAIWDATEKKAPNQTIFT